MEAYLQNLKDYLALVENEALTTAHHKELTKLRQRDAMIDIMDAWIGLIDEQRTPEARKMCQDALGRIERLGRYLID